MQFGSWTSRQNLFIQVLDKIICLIFNLFIMILSIWKAVPKYQLTIIALVCILGSVMAAFSVLTAMQGTTENETTVYIFIHTDR